MPTISSLALHLLLGVSAVAAIPVLPAVQVGFNDASVATVRANMLEIAVHSWEIGTATEALIELDSPSLSVFSAIAVPPPTRLSDAVNLSISEVRSIATKIVQNKPADSLPLVDGDGAVGDPASIGVAVLLSNWTRTNLNDHSFSDAATGQLAYLLTTAPRNTDGAISHRSDQVQLWADFVYMAPPFIAYFGALSSGTDRTTLLQEAYDQCRLYRDNLRDADSGLWKHIVFGDSGSQDFTHWGTGNAWAAAGMLRVLETLQHSTVSSQFRAQEADLTSWIEEIVSSTWKHQQSNGTLLNVLDDSTSFADSSSTALLAAVTYRMVVITKNTTHIPAANRALQVIQSSVDSDGWLLNTVDPLTFHSPSAPGVHSPEGQAFVLLLHAAWRDYVDFLATESGS